nr:hypothetical protein BAR15_160109 [Bartonella sp. AR 15-3]
MPDPVREVISAWTSANGLLIFVVCEQHLVSLVLFMNADQML